MKLATQHIRLEKTPKNDGIKKNQLLKKNLKNILVTYINLLNLWCRSWGWNYHEAKFPINKITINKISMDEIEKESFNKKNIKSKINSN